MEVKELPDLGVRLREHRWEDIPALVAIYNRTWVDEPGSVEQEEHWEKTYPADNPRRRWVAEGPDGGVVGVGACLHPFWLEPCGRYCIDIIIDPAWRGRGIGRALLAELAPFAVEQGAETLWTSSREDFAHSTRFLERAGFAPIGVRFESKLNLETFDPGRFTGAIERVTAAGYTLTTLAELRRTDPDTDRRFYDLECAAVADVPLPGGARLKWDFETWRDGTLTSPTFDPAAVFVAVDGDQWVGVTALDLPPHGPVITTSTGVLREHRGRGIAMALKLMSLLHLQARGYKEARTHNDTANPPILHLNEKIGYQRLPGWLEWLKPLGTAKPSEES